jgi:hypothetical protein
MTRRNILTKMVLVIAMLFGGSLALATPASAAGTTGCNGSTHCYVYKNGSLYSQAYVIKRSFGGFQVTISSNQWPHNQAIWVDLFLTDGSQFKYSLPSELDSAAWTNPYTPASWRLCDGNAGRCTGWSNA